MNIFERALALARRFDFEIQESDIQASELICDGKHMKVNGRVHLCYCLSEDAEAVPPPYNSLDIDDLKGEVCIGTDTELADLHEQVEWTAGNVPHLAEWAGIAPFMKMGNGDFLGFKENVGVIYLDHVNGIDILHPDPFAFWDIWSGLGFLGPEWWWIEGLSCDRLRFDRPTKLMASLKHELDSYL